MLSEKYQKQSVCLYCTGPTPYEGYMEFRIIRWHVSLFMLTHVKWSLDAHLLRGDTFIILLWHNPLSCPMHNPPILDWFAQPWKLHSWNVAHATWCTLHHFELYLHFLHYCTAFFAFCIFLPSLIKLRILHCCLIWPLSCTVPSANFLFGSNNWCILRCCITLFHTFNKTSRVSLIRAPWLRYPLLYTCADLN